MLKYFKIYKLFGEIDVNISLKNNVNIYVGENGIGKTTILNLLHAFLVTDIKTMSSIDFEKVTFVFSEHQYSFNVKDIRGIIPACEEIEPYMSPRRRAMMSYDINKIVKIVGEMGNELIDNLKNVRSYYHLRQYLTGKVYNKLKEKFSSMDVEMLLSIEEKSINLIQKLLEVKKELKNEILYFPTFRRIETDLRQFNFSEDEIQKITKNKLLNFGMADVEDLLKKKLEAIDSSIKQGYSKMTTTLLTQYVDNKDRNIEKIDIEKLNTLLGILSDTLPEGLKERLASKVENQSIYNSINIEFLNFVNNLLMIYEAQGENFFAIEKFVEICNKYFVNKKLVFEKNNLKVKIQDNYTQRPIEFSNLSSGEKQMASLFSKLYLDSYNDYFILFDEPELSLSIEWQRMLIPDIINSGKCNTLITVTHSPFIFDNEYDKYARNLQDCLSR